MQVVFRRIINVFALAACVLFSGCSRDSVPTDASGSSSTLKVVVTYSILGDLVKQVAGADAEITTLVGPGGDAHTYEPTPSDSTAIAQAKLLFENGLHFETWLDKLFAASGSKATRVVVTQHIKPRTLPGAAQDEVDPHVWHDPLNAVLMIDEIEKALATANPSGSDRYSERARKVKSELQALDQWVGEQIADLPVERRKLVTSHDTFGYFADRYQFQVISVLGAFSSEASDPSAARVAEVVKQLQSLHVPAVFAENILNPKLTEQIAEQAGIKVVRTLYTDALGPPGSTGETYEKMVRFNVQALVEALR